MPIVEARNICKSFGSGDVQVNALQGISLTIEQGEFVSIMGPSGSGKSTFLSILGGVETPTSGQILLEGQDLAAMTDDARTLIRRRRIGFIFQSFNLLPTLTALENVMLPLELDGVSSKDARQRAMESLELVELDKRVGHVPSKLSGGEQQRVALARALVIRPALLLADEPTGNLDSRQSKRVTAMLENLVHQRGQTIVMVTHDAAVAAAAHRNVLLRDGALESDVTRTPLPAPDVS